MKQMKHILKISDPLKWLAKSILVFGLIAFSGYAADSRLLNVEPTKTELSEVRRANFKRVVKLEKVFNELHFLLTPPSSHPEDFISFLNHEEKRITVKLKSISKELPINEQDGFLIYYATESSEEFKMNYILG
ncbi:hypothetical protein SanaruYs_16230 [Chryseotalea sanaruensis]|uniref:Uncharacterized protein n=1 Tax=Chryseotalea sanaruensis TaxID=2482724 RepID=A0A401U920_9BACT|nr:hypothetical protein [Chryseotalea sanaruensis]GCC51398.1 hypothetical protein SanaruYs_16230 [Chryseotalea sanaruensis]